ncbi:sigma-70 family RNA polymerase sigma factor [Nostoc sp. CENA67]|uniref:Sigma-70 family RNA polymerase sigma factor n=1 Tax=Amazonocrinis nigriterrae CENA67 TaxID=2794033 RepID=A0A8J7HSG4_9NOST|nr:sigma-70 family RNA polymerase sigma factor [Amazonocrinis nigriterrae]MBH8561609.1 sigma-70 family RNA polymerase sigma factor [Amazonocrinis nigriterrae CENA67]
MCNLLTADNLVKEQPDEQLKCLVAQACRHLPGSQERQKLLTQIIRLSSSKLWKESTPYYQDALQQTWLYFCRNVCEGLTGQTYDPAYGSVITWLNAYLKRRLQDSHMNQYREQATKVPLKIRQSGSGGNSEIIDPVDNLPATPQAPPILEELEVWVKTDSDGELRSIHVKGRPEINCQVLILKRLPPEVSWKELSEEFGLSIPTLSSFYQRQCLPRLRKFAKSEGWL